MTPRFETISDKKLVGKRLSMSLVNNRTAELWQSFMPHRKEIKSASGDLFSLQVYDPLYFQDFSPGNVFEKWALAEVADFSDIPAGIESFTLEGGLYAVFNYTGPANEGAKVFQYIFMTWLPGADVELDNRPHFEVLGEKYRNNEPDSEEEIWIPVKVKS